MVSAGRVALTSLDYIAYALVPPSADAALKRWERDEMGSIDELRAELLESDE